MRKVLMTFPFIYILLSTENKLTAHNRIVSSDSLVRLFLTAKIDELLPCVKAIMNDLKIKVRPSINLDEPLRREVVQLPEGYPSFFKAEAINVPSPTFRHYNHPTIQIAPSIDSILKKGFVKGSSTYSFLISSIVHELAHYLQLTQQSDISNEVLNFSITNDRRKYINDPAEFEAYAVGYYYYLYYVRRHQLEVIIGSKVSSTRKMKLIINAADSLLYPGSQPIYR